MTEPTENRNELDTAETPAVPEEAENTALEENAAEAAAPGKSPLSVIGDVYDILEMFIGCMVLILLLFTFVWRPTIVQGESMMSTLYDKDILLVNQVGYKPAQGDIVIVQNVGLAYYPEAIVKRVIAVGGQTIDIDFASWTVTVDGEVIDEPYRQLIGFPLTSDWSYPIEIPEGYVFVMGDNRFHSADSRCEEIGLIDERCIVGHALVRLFPFSRFTLFH